MAPRFEELIERHHDEIFRYVWRLLGSDHQADGAMDAEDLVQDVFLRAYENFATLRVASNYRAWLYKIATNRTLTILSRSKQRREKSLVLQHESESAAAPTQDCKDNRVTGFIEALPAKQNAAVTLRYLQDLDYAEIAAIMDCSEETARANVSQAIRRLRLLLQEGR